MMAGVNLLGILRLSDLQGANTLNFNKTFTIPEHSDKFRLSPKPIPRAHGDRAQDTAYLSSSQLNIIGYVGVGRVGGSGSLPVDSSREYYSVETDQEYLDALRGIFGLAHLQTLGVLDFFNGWIHYVRVKGLKTSIANGYPDLRKLIVSLFLEDPLAYEILRVSGVSALNTSSLITGGNAPSSNWRMRIQLLSGVERVVAIEHNPGGQLIWIRVPVDTALIIDGYNKLLYPVGGSDAPEWSRWITDPEVTGSVVPQFVLFNPGANSFSFSEQSTTPGLPGVGLTVGTDISVEFTARGADWLGSSVRVPSALSGQYDLAQYDLDIYG